MTNATNELAAFLGKNFEPHKMAWTPHIEAERLAKFRSFEAFQNDKDALYLYAYRETRDPWWTPHLAFAREIVTPDLALLDYHCATGWNGLRLVDDYGYSVTFADNKTRCTTFLAARLKTRGIKDKVQGLANVQPLDAVMAFDCAWRYEDPWRFVGTLASLASIVVLDLDSRKVDAAALVKRIDKVYPIINHRIVNHYVNLVAFRTGGVPVAGATETELEDSDG